jgi:hypothetical protein
MSRGRPKEEHSELVRFRLKASYWLKLNDYAKSNDIKVLSKAAHKLVIKALEAEYGVIPADLSYLKSDSR